jgi:hypothetical protein
MNNLVASMRNSMLSAEAQLAADEYLRNSERIRELENRQMDLLKYIKTLFDNQYGIGAEQHGLLPSGELHNQRSMFAGKT